MRITKGYLSYICKGHIFTCNGYLDLQLPLLFIYLYMQMSYLYTDHGHSLLDMLDMLENERQRSLPSENCKNQKFKFSWFMREKFLFFKINNTPYWCKLIIFKTVLNYTKHKIYHLNHFEAKNSVILNTFTFLQPSPTPSILLILLTACTSDTMRIKQ